MAPKAGTNKVGLRRVDAAIDALAPLGFPRELVLKTVNDLLKVYEGHAGWVFIEEASYRMLIETILHNQEEEEAQARKREEDKVKNEERTAENREACDKVSHDDAPSDTTEFGGDVVWKDIFCAHESKRSSDGWGQPSLPSHEVDQPSGRSRRRAPCFGWLCESEEENESKEPEENESKEPEEPEDEDEDEDEDELEEPPSNASIVYQDQERVEFAGGLLHEVKKGIYQEQDGVGFPGSQDSEMKQMPPNSAASIFYPEQEVTEFVRSLHRGIKQEPPSNASIIYRGNEPVEFAGGLHPKIKQEPPTNGSIIHQEQHPVEFAGSMYHEIKQEPASSASIVYQEQEGVEFAGSLHRGRKRRGRWDVQPSDM